MVITGLIRNQFDGNVTWVRIPHPPPRKSSEPAGLLDFSFCCFAFPLRLCSCSVLKILIAGQNRKTAYASLGVATSPAAESHLLVKSPVSGSFRPLSITCAEVILER